MQGQPDSLTLHEQGVHDRARELLADMRAKTSAAVAAADLDKIIRSPRVASKHGGP